MTLNPEPHDIACNCDKCMLTQYRLYTGRLLAVIHRDGGHHSEKHGIVRSAADAEAKVLKMREALWYYASMQHISKHSDEHGLLVEAVEDGQTARGALAEE